jgi:hypothetical protein
MSGSIMALPVLAGAIILIVLKKTPIALPSDDWFSVPQKYLLVAFGIFFVLSLISGSIIDSLLIVYPICIICAALMICIQISSKNCIPGLILIEIIVLLLNLIYSVIFRYPLYFGFTDLFLHMHFSHVTTVLGSVIPTDLDYGYAKFPLYHIWVAMGAIITGMDVQSSFFLICPVFAIGVIFLYYIAMNITQNQQLSLFACLAYALNSIVIFYGKYMITRTLAYVGFIVALYVLYRVKEDNNKFGFNVILVLFSLFIVLVHHVSIVQILLVIAMLVISERIIAKERYVNPFFIAFLSVLFLSYWFYAAFDYFKMLVDSRMASGVTDSPIIIPGSPIYSPDIFLANNLELLVFLFFAIIGIGYILHSKKSSYLPVIAFFSLFAMFFYIPNPLSSIWQFTELFRFDRFKLLISPFLAIIMASGMVVTLQFLIQRKKPALALLVILALFSIYCCGSLGVIHLHPDTSSRDSFTSDEFEALTTIQKTIVVNSTIHSDYYIQRFFQKNKFWLAQPYDLPYYNSKVILNSENLSVDTGYFIFAKKQFLGHGLRFSRGNPLNPEGSLYTFTPSEENATSLYLELDQKAKVYSNGAIEMYFSEPVV